MDINVEYGPRRVTVNKKIVTANKDIAKKVNKPEVQKQQFGSYEDSSSESEKQALPIPKPLNINSINAQEFKQNFKQAFDDSKISELGAAVSESLIQQLVSQEKLKELDTDEINDEWFNKAAETITELLYTRNLNEILVRTVDTLLPVVSVYLYLFLIFRFISAC